jgi:hypothetical protein
MGFLRCALSEWPFLRIRLLRTRLGVWLVLLLVMVLRLNRTSVARDPLAAVLLVAGAGATLCVAYLAGARADRAALGLALLHPRFPGAMTVGRWLAATSGAAILVLVAAIHARLGVALAGVVTAATMSAWTLALAWWGGNVLVGAWLIWLALGGGASPEAVLAYPHPGAARYAVAGALELLPALWRYRGLAIGEPGATAHAAVWIVFGLAGARARAARAMAQQP